jgi:outer membrane protein
MKKYFAIITLTFAISGVAMAQTKSLKIGYTNVDYLLSQMPESKQIESELKTYKTQLDNQLQAKVKDFQEKYQAYEKGAATMTDVIRMDKEKQLQNLQEEIEEFQKNAQSSLQKKEVTLLQPALDKIQKNIDIVAKESGYTYVFNTDGGLGTTPILLHGPEEDNISDLILKKMGITPAPKKTDAPRTTPGAKPAPGK